MSKTTLVFMISGGVILADLASKIAVVNFLSLGAEVSVIAGILSITHINNHGVAFGFLRDLPDNFRVIILSAIAFVAIAMISAIIKRNPTENKYENSALALILGGAVGNLVNRIHSGYVTDFIDFHLNYSKHFPAFNLADSAICLGVALLLYNSVYEYFLRKIGRSV